MLVYHGVVVYTNKHTCSASVCTHFQLNGSHRARARFPRLVFYGEVAGGVERSFCIVVVVVVVSVGRVNSRWARWTIILCTMNAIDFEPRGSITDIIIQWNRVNNTYIYTLTDGVEDSC